jgi:hypothetical protein
MGGTSSSNQSQQSTTAPWQPAQSTLQGILGQLNGQLPNTGITGAQTGAINTIENNANATNQFTPQINRYTGDLLNGGGALTQAPNIQSGFNQFSANTSPLANNTNYDPRSTPGLGGALDALNSDITQQINGQFAAAGRDGSGYNQQALARGLSQGEGQLLTNQYNQNVQNQQQAAGNLYNAGNTNSGLLAGLQQQYLANQGAGVSNVGAGLNAQNAGANATLQAEAQKFGIPAQNLGLLAQIGIPIAGLGGQSTGTAQGSQTMSGAQQFANIGQGAAGIAKLLFG